MSNFYSWQAALFLVHFLNYERKNCHFNKNSDRGFGASGLILPNSRIRGNQAIAYIFHALSFPQNFFSQSARSSARYAKFYITLLCVLRVPLLSLRELLLFFLFLDTRPDFPAFIVLPPLRAGKSL